jgi:hypothetical protein
MLPIRHVWCCCLAAIVACVCCAARSIDDVEYKFRVNIPDGFEANEEDLKQPDVIYSFLRLPKDPSKSKTIIRIKRMRGTLPANLPIKSFSQGGIRFEVTPEKWKKYTLPKASAVMQVGGSRVLAQTVQIPLVPEAISIIVAGSADDEQELSALMQNVVASVDGETNWIDGSDPRNKTEEKRIVKDMYVCLAILAVIGIVIYSRRRGQASDETQTGEPQSK